MYISLDTLKNILEERKIQITGALHIGAHNCEEMGVYEGLGLNKTDIIWVDAINNKVLEAQNRGIPNVYNAIITDTDDSDIQFNISNNIQSSSILEFGTHSTEHPGVVYVDKILGKSITLDSFVERNGIDAQKLNFWNFDIQGAELMALKGGLKNIKHVKAMYLEVNEKELYKNCALIGEIDAFLSTYNFKRVETHMTNWGWGDALYIRD